MTSFASLIEAFFTDWLTAQRRVSPATVTAYRDTFRLFLQFAAATQRRAPSSLDLADLDATLVASFLQHLETGRGNTVRTRNARLAALRSFYRFAQLRCPEHAALIARVLATPQKRGERKLISFLENQEADALLAAPDRSTWPGRRDHALLLLAIQTGLRVSELARLHRSDLHLGPGAHVRCQGKGRKERVTPMTKQTAAAIKDWLTELPPEPATPVFASPRGTPLTRSAIEKIVARHAQSASASCPSLASKRTSPHTLRHTCAMRLLWAGIDTSVIALWLGHERAETTQVYLHADLVLKEKALQRTAPLHVPPGRYQPGDQLLAFLESL
jgi:site-specific recombinase XerD